MRTVSITIFVAVLVLFGTLNAAEPAIQQGLVVLVDCRDVPENLYANKALRIHGLTKDAALVQSLRKTLLVRKAADVVLISMYDGQSLPYIDNMVNHIIAPETTSVSREEMLRVLVPLGRAVIGDKVVVKPWPTEIDEWSHYLYDASNNAVSNDKLVGPPKHMQWLGTTFWARNHDQLASMSAIATTRGRLYFIMDNGPIFDSDYEARWFLEAIDAFNGLPLWKRPMKSWVDHTRRFRSGPVQIARLLVAHEDTVYTTLGLNEPVVAIDGKTGETIKTYDNTEKVEEILYHQGKLIVVVNRDDVEHAGTRNAFFAAKAIKLIDAQSGKEIWRWPDSGFADILPDSLAARGQQVFLQCEVDTICLDLQSGKEQWRTTTFEKMERLVTKAGNPRKEKKEPKTVLLRRSGWTYNTLVISQNVVLSSDHQTLIALSTDDGSRLWDAAIRPNFNLTPAEDILVIDGLVWTSPNLTEGRDLKTGKIVKTLDLKETMVTTGHHHRCYRNRGVDGSIIYGYRGMEFFDTQGENHSRNNWIRGVCQWGVMPANGLMYAPPHDCGCYLEAMLHGFWALAPERQSLQIPAGFSGQLEKGPAYGRLVRGASEKSDWPTYRKNAARGGVSDTSLPSTLHQAWSVPVGQELTPPVIAHNTVLLACRKDKTVYALDAATGRTRWYYVAGGVVDSAPTIVNRRVLFGAADGTVTCLSLDDGDVMWRFMAAPSPLKAMAMGELESLWPVCGSVLVKYDTAYFTAGRSTYLDGGLFLFGLSIETGEVKYKSRMHINSPSRLENKKNQSPQKNGPNTADFKTFEAADKSDSFSMFGNTNDVMVADKNSVYLRHMRFDDRLEPQTDFRHHLFSTSTFLDPHEAYRSHWIYGNGNFSLVPVSYEWLTRAKSGQQSFYTFAGSICVHDGATLWGVTRDRTNGILVASDIQGLDQRYSKDFGEGRRDKIDMGYHWTTSLSFHTRAMVKAGPALYLAGGASVEQILGEAPGGMLQSFAATDGSQKGPPVSLKAPPVFDGMAVAGQALFISLIDGSLVCLK